MVPANKKAETKGSRKRNAKHRPGVLVRCSTEVEKGGKGSGWVQPIWQHRNVEASVVLIEDSLPKTRKFTCKFSVSICRKYQAIDPPPSG